VNTLRITSIPRGKDWLRQLEARGTAESILAELQSFREVARKWHFAAHLPPAQFILAAVMALALDTRALASVHKMALLLRDMQDLHPEWTLAMLNAELLAIAKNERRIALLSAEGEGFDPEAYRGRFVVATFTKPRAWNG
jgi:hypothetical protein